MKRALRNFGNLLGNCIYDKEYVAKVTKLKAGPIKWDPENLHRHPDFAPVKEASSEPLRPQPSLPQMKQEAHAGTEETRATINGLGEDEFGSDDFDAVDFAVSDGDHPDEVILDASLSSDHFTHRTGLPKRKSPSKIQTGDSRNVLRVSSPSLGDTGPQTPNTGRQPLKPQPSLFQQPNNPIPGAALPHQNQHSITNHARSKLPSLDSSNSLENEPPVGFFTARAAECLQAGPCPATKAPLFNPHLESPSIRKTAGVDHTRTKPVNRDLTEAAPPPPPPPPPPPSGATAGALLRGNAVNPQTDRARRVGMPVGASSPLQNRGSYRPPQMKRPMEGVVLRDVTAASVNAGDPVDTKKQKVMVNGELRGSDEMVKV